MTGFLDRAVSKTGTLPTNTIDLAVGASADGSSGFDGQRHGHRTRSCTLAALAPDRFRTR